MKIEGSLQENLVTLLCFDEKNAPIIRNSISLNLIESAVLREIASVAFDYYDRFQRPIGDHLADEFDEVINNKKERRKGEYYAEVLESIYGLADTINAEYVMTKLERFVRAQTVKAGITGAVEAIQNDDLDEAESILTASLNKQIASFKPGVFMTDLASLAKGINSEAEQLSLGIPTLDRYGAVPTKGEMLLYIGPPKSGKTQFSMHCAKAGVVNRWKTLVISLEMNETKYHKRLMQAFFSITKRADDVYNIAQISRDDKGMFVGVTPELVKDRPSFQDDGILDTMDAMIGRLKNRAPLLIKHFPSGSLTMSHLKAYLDSLERFYNFVPDLVVLDYPDIMHIKNPANKRHELDAIYVSLRGLASERNFALVAPTQASKNAKKERRTTGEDASEAYSKKHHADCVLTYSQTEAEKGLGLARIWVDASRYDRDGMEVVISQCYGLGQFCLTSAEMVEDYWEEIDMEDEVE